MKDTISQITKKFMDGATLEGFSQELGVPGVTRKHVWNWVSGKNAPDAEVLLRVLLSSSATENARNWARECLSVRLSMVIE
jgi:hypothetical protein